jgi:hypothetical protein
MLTSPFDMLTLGNFRKCRIIGSTLSFESYRRFFSTIPQTSSPLLVRAGPTGYSKGMTWKSIARKC